MFDHLTHVKLLELTIPSADEYLKRNKGAIIRSFLNLGIPESAEIVAFYTDYGSYRYRGYYELVEVDEIAGNIEHYRDEFGLDSKMVAISNYEGGGFLVYNKESGSVYDVEIDRIDELNRGILPPISDTFSGFVKWALARR